VLGDCVVNETNISVSEYVVNRAQHLRKAFGLARKHMRQQAVSRAFRYDLRVKAKTFIVG